jgi:hypothetical protein
MRVIPGLSALERDGEKVSTLVAADSARMWRLAGAMVTSKDKIFLSLAKVLVASWRNWNRRRIKVCAAS